MELVFTEDHGRYKKGDKKDWPHTTWRSFFPGFERYTATVDEVVAESAVKKGKANAKRANG